jgi:tight adherence protein B
VSWAPVLAFASGVTGALALCPLGAAAARAARGAAPALARLVSSTADALVRLGREGRDPRAIERRRMLVAGAAGAFALGWFLAGPLPGAVLATGGPWVVARVLSARRERYRRAVEEGSAAIAVGVADAIGGGHSLRGAIAEAAPALSGAAGAELRRVAAELAAGAATDEALEAMRARVRSERVDSIVAACLLQRRAGGDLARLLRDCARAFEDQSRLEGEVRAATAQARFTGVVVVLLPLGGALLAELASPGFLERLLGSFLTAWLVGIALGLQLLAAVLIRRLGRVKW